MNRLYLVSALVIPLIGCGAATGDDPAAVRENRLLLSAALGADPGRLVVLNEPLAADLGLDPGWLRSPEGLQLLVGTPAPDDFTPLTGDVAVRALRVAPLIELAFRGSSTRRSGSSRKNGSISARRGTAM